MPTYRLNPINPDDPVWRALSSVQQVVWAAAESTDDARKRVADKTRITAKSVGRFARIQQSPWLSDSLATCVLDTARFDVPSAVVVKADGRVV